MTMGGVHHITKGGTRREKKVSSADSTETFDKTFDKQALSKLSGDDRFLCLYDNLTKNRDILNDMRRDQSRYFRATEELQTSVVKLCERAEQAERVVGVQNEHIKMLAYRTIDMEARSRRNNLVFYGLSERATPNIPELIFGFLEDELDLDTSGLVIDRAHRLGPRPSGSSYMYDPKRPIIVKFRDYMATEYIIKRAYKLKGTHFGIDRDYPMEIASARKQLYSSQEAKDARQNRKKIQIAFPAKLIIEGRLIMDKFPEWHRYMRTNRMEVIQFQIDTHDRMDLIGGAANHLSKKSKGKSASSDSETERSESSEGESDTEISNSETDSVFSQETECGGKSQTRKQQRHGANTKQQKETQSRSRDNSRVKDSKLKEKRVSNTERKISRGRRRVRSISPQTFKLPSTNKQKTKQKQSDKPNLNSESGKTSVNESGKPCSKNKQPESQDSTRDDITQTAQKHVSSEASAKNSTAGSQKVSDRVESSV